jgi:hypothetical protein
VEGIGNKCKEMREEITKERKSGMRSDDRTEKLKEWERNPGEKRYGDKGKKDIQEKKKEGVGSRYQRNHSPLSFNGILHCISNSFMNCNAVSRE